MKSLSCSTFLPDQKGSARSNVGLFLDLKEVSTLFSPGEMKKITPQKLKQQPIGAGIGHALFFVAADLFQNEFWGEAAPGDPRGKLGGVGSTEHAVAGLLVFPESVFLPHPLLEAIQASAFSTSEGKSRMRMNAPF